MEDHELDAVADREAEALSRKCCVFAARWKSCNERTTGVSSPHCRRRSPITVRRPGYYAARIAAVTVLYAGGWTAFVLVGAIWWTLAVAGFLAVVLGQVALLAHDIAHRQVFRLLPAAQGRRGRGADRREHRHRIGMGNGWWQDARATTPTTTTPSSTPTSNPT
ncbi:hypothetical protein [Streptomyces sp. SM13]|uniref:hypothetical protein n=1 Tax=Streptomyces sp. SM13 TaxID=1983803 RepID=UPI0027E43DF9|nr:hypothetical protein [Streptomyces sp. SM13]